VSDLAYALVQVGHNLGAAGVVAPPAAALWWAREAAPRRRLAWLSLAVWSLQALTGAGFAAVSWTTKGALPEVESIALAALATKLLCTVVGIAVGLLLVRARAGASLIVPSRLWSTSLAAGVVALVGAAFLRWYL